MATTRKTASVRDAEIAIPSLSMATGKFRIIGTTPLLQSSMASKTKCVLLVGGGKKTKAEKAGIKHHPLEEFREAAEIVSSGPTALGLKIEAIKGAMCTAALSTAGIAMTEAKRLINFETTEPVPLYGTPLIKMFVVRSADMAKTPDIRSKPYLPVWGAEFSVRWVRPQLSLAGITTLLQNAGIVVGVGDGRQEKGKFSYGSFRVLSDGQDDEVWDELVKNHGREAQEIALSDPLTADIETERLLEFYHAEVRKAA